MLKNRVCVKNKGITQDIFDAMVAIAMASGFDLSKQEDGDFNNYVYAYIGVEDRYGCLQDVRECMLDVYTSLSIEDWLFSLAEDYDYELWEHKGCYYYKGKSEHYSDAVRGLGMKAYRPQAIGMKLIATRKQGQWIPKVNEKCLHNGSICTPLIVKPDSDGMVVVECDGEYVIAENNNFSEIKHTEQELLAYELFKLMFEDDVHELDAIKEFESYINCLKIVESGRFK